jgi:hypothetical protein
LTFVAGSAGFAGGSALVGSTAPPVAVAAPGAEMVGKAGSFSAFG